ncbi:MAG: hypothetical protein IIB54_01915 [Planctomycetes bacterium]|nr:hypothetical protein [Planctomycetota bacterium]
MNEIKHTVGIIGAGTMGAGIAQVASCAGWTVELMDVDEAVVSKAIESIKNRLDRLVEKGLIDGKRQVRHLCLLILEQVLSDRFKPSHGLTV